MAFESLTEKLQNTFRKLKGKGKVNEKDLKEAMREVKLALLEADVNFRVVKDFVKQVTERASGAEVMESLTPAQQVIKIVNEEMIALMGGEEQKLEFASKPPTVIMMAGLQGAGKTTTAAKLGGILKKQGKRPLLCACDVYRPAAVKQLQVVGEKLELPVYAEEGNTDAVAIAKAGLAHAIKYANDILIIDTAGRLHIDETLMEELKQISAQVNPTEILLVVDAMTGQDAVNVASSFNEKIGIDGVIVTKLDGDTRGGAALSIKAVTGRPILYVGMGEKLSDLEQFYPDRMASRILGMGDVLSLIEKAGESIDEEQAKEMSRKMKKAQFDFEDYLMSMQQMKKMGGLSSVMSMMPGLGNAKVKDADLDQGEKQMARIESIIYSMTPQERRNPDILNPSRKRRIAKGAGVDISEVNRLVKQFEQMKKMMKQLPGMMGGFGGKKGRFRLPF